MGDVLVIKTLADELQRLDTLLAGQEETVRSAFLRFVADVQSLDVVRRVRRILETQGIEAALDMIRQFTVQLGDAIDEVFQEMAEDEVERIARSIFGPEATAPRVGLSFDPAFPRAAETMRRNRLEFLREFEEAQREAAREAMVESFRQGLGAIGTARAFRDSIGLTNFQRLAVANYRRMLENGDATALMRDLRDRRFDRSVRRAIDTGEPLGPERIARMVERYRQRYLQYRAETIARTETVRSASLARDEALRQTIDRLGISPSDVERTWRSTRDNRVRDTHREMDGQVRGLSEPFVSPAGSSLMYPGDPAAPAEEVINCRCVYTVRIRPSTPARAR